MLEGRPVGFGGQSNLQSVYCTVVGVLHTDSVLKVLGYHEHHLQASAEHQQAKARAKHPASANTS
jgi:hypothetical protein